jgi:phage gp36-like protein
MTAYATQSDISGLYGENALVVADHDRDGIPDAVPVANALDYATAEIDSYLATRHSLPLAEVPLILKKLCVDIALHQLALSGELMTEEIEKRYDRALATLRDLSTGKAKLVFTVVPGAVTEDGDFRGPQPVVVGGPDRLFTRDAMRDL